MRQSIWQAKSRRWRRTRTSGSGTTAATGLTNGTTPIPASAARFTAPGTLQALALPSGTFSEAHEQSVVKLFESMLLPNAPFAGTVLCKHPTYQFTMLGAWRHGRPNDAAAMAEAIMRDITMAGEFAECYSFTFPPRTEGVTPSLFGVANTIDGTLLAQRNHCRRRNTRSRARAGRCGSREPADTRRRDRCRVCRRSR